MKGFSSGWWRFVSPRWLPGRLCCFVLPGPERSRTVGSLCGSDVWRPRSCWWTVQSPRSPTQPGPPGPSPEGRSRWRSPPPWARCSGRFPLPSWRFLGCLTLTTSLLEARSSTQAAAWRWPPRCWTLAVNGGSRQRWSWWRWHSAWWLAAVEKVSSFINSIITTRQPKTSKWLQIIFYKNLTHQNNNWKHFTNLGQEEEKPRLLHLRQGRTCLIDARVRRPHLAGCSLLGGDRVVGLQWGRLGHGCVQRSVVWGGSLLELWELWCQLWFWRGSCNRDLWPSLGRSRQGPVFGDLRYCLGFRLVLLSELWEFLCERRSHR